MDFIRRKRQAGVRARATGHVGLTLAVGLICALTPRDGRAAGPEEGGSVPVERLNTGLPVTDDPPDLETPQASLENFMLGTGPDAYVRAARSLNLNAVKPALQPSLGPELARQLKEVIDQQLWFDWGGVPDRPDGRNDDPAILHDGSGEGGSARTSLRLGSLNVGDLDVEIRLERVKPPDGGPVWVFSRQTVGHIPLLYEHYRSNRLESSIPAFFKTTKFARVAVWQWVGFVVTLAAAGALGNLVQRGLDLALRLMPSAWTTSAAEAIRGPGALTIGLVIAHYAVKAFLGLSGPVLSILEPLYAAVLVFGSAWFLHRFVGLAMTRVARRYEEHGGDDANVWLTRLAVARHLVMFLIVVVGAGYALSRFEWFRRMGTTLLASAGVAGLILGVAAQRMLGNLFAGILLALTQPVKAGDAILFEGQFGWVEEIAVTYLVIRSWDLRRIVVPITYFLDHPFQNWSRRSQHLMMPVFIRADYRVDVEAVRREFKAAMESSTDWDKVIPPILQVTDCHDDTIELRALCSASDPAASWNLQCHVRERLVTFLRDLDGGRYLPRKRVSMVDDPPSPPRPADDSAASQDDEPSSNGPIPCSPSDPCPDGEGVAGPPMPATPPHQAPTPGG